MGWARLELATNGLKVRCSNQLSYQPQARYYDFLLFYCQTAVTDIRESARCLTFMATVRCLGSFLSVMTLFLKVHINQGIESNHVNLRKESSMNKLKLIAAIASTGLLGVASQSAQAQAEAWQGPWVHVGVGAATFIPGFSGGQYLGAYPYSGTKKDINTVIASISAGYTLAISGPWSLGLGATIAPGTSPSANYAVEINTPRGISIGPGTYNVANIYSITLQPGYAIDKEKLVYAKVGYSGATANTNSDSFGKASSTLSGYTLGLGYKQVISGGLYGYAEFNYANYSNVTVPYSQLTGNINATGMDVMVGLGYRF